MGLAVVTYDSTATLKRFSDERGIGFPLLSDPGSAIIARYGILNTTIEKGNRAYGVPFPGTFVLDAGGRVVARYFEAAYQERNTAASILAKQGIAGGGPALSATTAHLRLQLAASDAVVSPGSRFTLTLEVTPNRGVHVYAPGRHTYQVVTFRLDPSPWLQSHPVRYPPSEIYHFVPLDERVETYQRTFTLTEDVTVLATEDAQKALAAEKTLAVSGAFEYQACDDTVCYAPTRVPLRFTLDLSPLVRPQPR